MTGATISLIVALLVGVVLIVAARRLAAAGPPATYAEPGTYRVVLQVTGGQPIAVIRELRRTTGADLVTARDLAGQAPVIVAENLSEASAAAVVERLAAAGARAVANPMDPTP